MAEGSFERLGACVPTSPVVLSVPHAGRVYPYSLLQALRVPAAALVALEDRYVDAVARAAAGPRSTLIARHGRAWIDLNRAEDERDPRVDEWAIGRPVRSAKVRAGLGLVPRRGANATELWRRRFTEQDVNRRIMEDHRPYHAALAEMLEAARQRFGVAVLVDLHSMPSLGAGQARVVIGDRFGRSAAPHLAARAEAVVISAKCAVQRNSPYAGGHVLDRHGQPNTNVHALQIELDRTLYLDAALDRPGKGMTTTVAMVAQILSVLEDEAIGSPALNLAAE